MITKEKCDVFVSYSSEDAGKAREVCLFLEEHNVKCWIAPRDIKPGSSYPAQILGAIRNSHILLLLASENTNSSEHVSNEIEIAFGNKKIIIPFMLADIKFSDEQLYFLARKQHIDAYSDFDAGLKSLLTAIDSYGQKQEHEESTASEHNPIEKMKKSEELHQEEKLMGTVVISGQKAFELFSVETIVENTLRIEYETMKELNEDNAENREQWIELFNAFPETLCFLLVDGAMVGFWHFVCLEDESFEAAKRGEYSCDRINMDDVEYLHFPGTYNGYFSSIAILPTFRSAKTFQLLINALIEQIESFAENDIYITRWCTNAFTKEGKAMSKSLRLQYLCDNAIDGEMYFSEIETMLEAPLFKRYTRLLELYNNFLSNKLVEVT